MKKILGTCTTIIIGFVGVFAYTPSDELVERMDAIIEKIETVVEQRGDSYKTRILTLIETYQERYSENEAKSYIFGYLYDGVSNIQIHSGELLVSSEYAGSYTIDDAIYGTKVEVVVSGDTRTMTSNALPNHDTGEFPNSVNPNTISAQDKTRIFTTTPNYTGNETWMRESGVAYNGVKFELETNERVNCESGEMYRIEAQQTNIDVIGLDFNHAHVQPTGEYHYHGVSDILIDTLEGDDIVHVGYATDGFPIYYSKQGTYTPSYELKTEDRVGTSCTYRDNEVEIDGTTPDGTFGSDWEYVEGLGNLDSCNGAFIDGAYGYFITEAFPFGPRCSNGEVSGPGGSGKGRPPMGSSDAGHSHMGPPPRGHGHTHE